MIPLLVPSMPRAEQLLPWLREIDQNAHYTNFGPLNGQFERTLLDHAVSPGADLHLTTVSNCTLGLELALQALQLPTQARVLIPGITFVATATAISRVGMTPVVGDVDPHTWVLTPEIAEAALSETRIDAVMPVSTFGYAHPPAEWDAFTARTGIPVLIDAAGAYGNQEAGRTTDVVYSFHATKSFGAAEGGAVLSCDAARIARIRQLANFGIDTSNGTLAGRGTNGKMSEYHAAIGLANFVEWPRIKRERIALHKAYLEDLALRCTSVRLQQKDREGIYPLMPVLLPSNCDAARALTLMTERGVQCRRWYSPSLHLHPALQDTPRMSSLENATDLGNRMLGIPFHLGLAEADRVSVIDALCATLDSIA